MIRWLRNQWDRAAAVVTGAAGAIALLAGWVGASDTVYPAQQIPFLISGGLVGVVLVLVGATLWISADLRDEWRKLNELLSAVTGEDLAPPHETSAVHAAPRERRVGETALAHEHSSALR